MRPTKPSRGRINEQRFHPLVSDDAPRVDKARSYIIGLKPGVTFANRGNRVASRQHSEDMLYRETSSPDDRFSAENFRIYCDSLEQFGFVHDDRLTESDRRFNLTLNTRSL
jgi:hypothetical protein